MPTLYLLITIFQMKRIKFYKMYNSPPCETYFFNFHQSKIMVWNF